MNKIVISVNRGSLYVDKVLLGKKKIKKQNKTG